MNIFDIAKQNQEKAWQVIKNTNIIQIWEDAGAKINLVGSLRTGLLMKHRDIDFHIYSSPLNLTDSFQAMARLAENPSIKRIECANLLHTAEACIEWHPWYQNEENELWQMDMIHGPGFHAHRPNVGPVEFCDSLSQNRFAFAVLPEKGENVVFGFARQHGADDLLHRKTSFKGILFPV